MLLTVIRYIGGAAITGIVSWCVAKITAKAEIQKLRETWAHEKEMAIDAEFDNMVAAISCFVKSPSNPTLKTAIEKTALFRSKANGDLAFIVDEISSLILHQCTNYDAISQKLNAAVKIKRGETGHSTD